MPKRSRSGGVSNPVRVVAPISGKGGRAGGSVRAAGGRRGRCLPRRGGGALADDNVEPVVLERRVEDLLDRTREPVDLVDEEDLALSEPGQDRRHVTLSLERGPGDRAQPDTQLPPDEVCG